MGRPAKNELKDNILNAASEKFFRYGCSRVSIDELVSDLHTSKSAIYRFFSSKEDLINSVMIHFNQYINTNIGLIINDKSVSFQKKLEMIMAFTTKVLQKVSKDFLDDLKINFPNIWKRYLEMREERLSNLYLKFFKQGIKQGNIRNDIPVNLILIVYTKLTEIVVEPDNRDSIGIGIENTYEMITSLFLEGTKPE
jgi:AcrR family transcriptional regulator